ncbi:hypothetical protein [Microtetraspora glauca]|uniref:ATP-binding protein n=1 Tax=Microtetraspora glauca TaxID=1996 RepID=A0ABV3GTL5_MICGL
MSDHFHTSVTSTHTQMHSGSGPQINNFFGTFADKKGKPFKTVAADDLLWLRRRFVDPPEFGRARGILESQGTVLLDGAPGSGRLAAAQMLLHELRVGEETFREMPLNDDEGELLLVCDDIADDDLLLLDLSTADQKLWTRAHRELYSVRAEVHKHRARLVVVLPDDRGERLEPGLGPYHVVIGRPPGPEVLRRYLRQSGFPPEAMRQLGPAAEFLSRMPSMTEIAHYAELVGEARENSEAAGDLAGWCKEAYAALSGRKGQVSASLCDLLAGSQRALLLATAMLHGAHADVVHGAAASLLREVKHPQEDIPLLEHADLLQRFKEIGAERDDDGRVRFTDLGYDAAVRRHFWTHMPEVREGLQAWVGRTVVSASLDQDERDDLVSRFADLCLDDRYREVLVSQVQWWSAGPVNGAGQRAAVQALTRGLQDQRHGWFFRRRIYDWSMKSGLSDTLIDVIIAMCTEVMAVHHPYEATVRLHHLARHERRTTRAREALTRFVHADPRLLRLMFDRLNRQFTEDNRYEVDVDLFLELADPELLAGAGPRARTLIARDVVRDQVTTGWAVVFEQRSDDVWCPPARRWLLAADEGGPRHDVLLDVLVEGGRQQTGVLSRLYVMAGELERSLPARPEQDGRLRDRVLRKINIALGIQAA